MRRFPHYPTVIHHAWSQPCLSLPWKEGNPEDPLPPLNVREHDWYNIRRLSEKLNLSIVDLIGLLVAKNMEALNLEPLTADRLAEMGPKPVDS